MTVRKVQSLGMLRALWLQHFRSYTNRSFVFSPGITLLVGENAQGKTNVLEAVSMLALGTSFRAQKIEEMVAWGQELGRIKGVAVAGVGSKTESDSEDAIDHPVELEVLVTTGMVQGKRVQKRKLLVDGAPRRRKDFAGNFSCVVFRPEDLSLVDGSPSLRRRYLDGVLGLTSREYLGSLDAYEKALIHRNRLLDALREGTATRQAFFYWDQLLVKHGQVLSKHRKAYMHFLSDFLPLPMRFEVRYDDSEISEDRLHHYAIQEVGAGHTLVGPHKDDFRVFSGSVLHQGSPRDLATYGSRGEQRMAALWLKSAELAYLKKYGLVMPTLLLDDVFSELDHAHQDMVVELAGQQQTFISSTPVTVPDSLLQKAQSVHIAQGDE